MVEHMSVTHQFLTGLTENAPLLALITPAPLLLPLLVPRKRANDCAPSIVRGISLLSLLSLLLALLSCIALIVSGKPVHHEFAAWGALGLTVYFDTVSAVMLLLVSFLAISA